MTIQPKAGELAPAELSHRCDPAQFDFATTADLPDLDEVVGQPRAVAAMQFGLGMDHAGYNIFALGPEGTGKLSMVQRFFGQRAATEPTPGDWCYVYNFEQPHRPNAIQLPAGLGGQLRGDMESLVERLRTTLAAAFEGEEYQTRRQAIAEGLQEQQSQTLERIQESAQQQGLTIVRTPTGLVIAPVRDGQVLSPEQVQQLTEEERKKLEQAVQGLQEELQKILRQVPAWQREVQEKLRELDQQVAEFAVGSLIHELAEKYAAYPKVVEYLQTVQKDVVENASAFLPSDDKAPDLANLLQGGTSGATTLGHYRVNVVVDHSGAQGAPVVYEDNPTYQNLVGRVEYLAQMGALVTDFDLIKGGALLRANGGYLILDARKVLTQPYAWEGLKRALQSNQVRIESLGQALSLVSTVSLEPEPIPLQLKVALVGEPLLYYLLYQADPDFGELFKVAADFAERMDRDAASLPLYARLLATLVRRENLRPFDRTAVARVIERSSRLVEDAEKLSTQMRSITDLLREADYWAEQAGQDVVTSADVDRAVDAQVYRSDRPRERVQEAIRREIILIDTAGERVGQINGLSVVQLGNLAFGQPSRITASVRLGRGQVVDIEREVELGGPIHSKGVLILSGFLGARYASDRPLSLSASLVFEQSYGGVEGDSASSAELYVLLSAIGEIPIRQSLAVTGSVNQHGQVQAIGGVNEKIEGFFDVCKARGLSGEQGVLIPVANVKHLMLRNDVVEAVAQGQFHIYPVETIDQGIEILTSLPAGERDDQGNYPDGSVNGRVQERLAELAAKLKAFAEPAKEGPGEQHGT